MKLHGESKVTPAELELLRSSIVSLPTGAFALEVGTRHGATARLLAEAAPHVHLLSVDTFYQVHRVSPEFWWRNRRANQTLFVGTVQALAAFGGAGFAWCWIDAMHTRQAVLADLDTCTAIGIGRILLHDYCPAWPGVMDGVDEFCSREGWEIVAQADSVVEIAPRAELTPAGEALLGAAT